MQRVIHFSFPVNDQVLVERLWTMRENFNIKANDKKSELMMYASYYFVPSDMLSDFEIESLKSAINFIKRCDTEVHSSVRKVQEFYKINLEC